MPVEAPVQVCESPGVVRPPLPGFPWRLGWRTPRLLTEVQITGVAIKSTKVKNCYTPWNNHGSRQWPPMNDDHHPPQGGFSTFMWVKKQRVLHVWHSSWTSGWYPGSLLYGPTCREGLHVKSTAISLPQSGHTLIGELQQTTHSLFLSTVAVLTAQNGQEEQIVINGPGPHLFYIWSLTNAAF